MYNKTLSASHAWFYILIQGLSTSNEVMVTVTTYRDKVYEIKNILWCILYIVKFTFLAFMSSLNVLGFLNNPQTTLKSFLGPHRKRSLSNDVIHTTDCMEEYDLQSFGTTQTYVCMYFEHENWPRICGNHVI